MRCKNLELLTGLNGEVKLSVTLLDKTDVRALQELTDIDILELTLKKYRKKRSLSQNSYLWVICDKIAKVLNSTKVEIYRIGIRNVGVYSDKDIKDEDVEFFVKSWRKGGDGWVCDKMIDKPDENYTTVRFHKGSSKYNTEEMARLIDYIITEAKELGIDTMSIEEVERLERKI